ncbi:MAG: hypothetical protein PHE32_03460 [Candidatus Shapirobacteria bacterium]|nr:hypothetical protein [Candidatus Shapirobacteria bacterium]MDD4410731.1 hypothetical protein [Candidatus Shapirobacteria bacterium]
MDTKKGFSLLQIVSIFLIVIVSVGFIFIGNKIGLFKKDLSPKNKFTAAEKKYCGYAKKTLTWINSKRDENGKYFGFIDCDFEKKTCNGPQEAGLSGHDAIPAIWARYKYIQKTGDTDEISILKKDIDYYYQQLDKMQVQNNFWNCRLLLEITDQKILSQEYLDKVHKLCTTSTYISSDEVKNIYSEKTKSDINVISQVDYYDWQNPDKTKDLVFKSDQSINQNYKWFVTFPSDFVARYKSSQKQNDLDVANAYFNKLLQGYYLDYVNFSANDKCLLAISSLDLYSVNKEQKYLDWAKDVYSLYFTDQGAKSEGMNLECAFLNRELAKYDNNSKYQSSEEKLLSVFISKYWDGDGSFRKLNGEGGFFLIEERNIWSKSLLQNALLVNLLCP